MTSPIESTELPTDAPTAPPAADTRPLTDVDFASFDLHPLLLQGLTDAGFVRCTPIQALTLPVALAGGDVAGQAQTGTGKTAAFLVALFNRLLTRPARAERGPSDPRAVVLAPTRELAIQIEKDARQIGAGTGLRFALIYGGVDYDRQRELLRQGCDVVIATPGRLIDYVKQHVVSFRAVEVVVLDEADRMFDLGFIKDIRFLLRRMPPREERQSLLFSATLSHRVLELAYEHMNSPEKLTVEAESVTATRVRQAVYFPAVEEKLPLLIGLLSRIDAHRTMVFVNTKNWVERVARALEQAQFRVGVLSGDVPQKKREQLLGRFKKGELEILVATDVAARGLHIADVSHVINFDLPFDAEDYVHRIGRTARLGAEGDAISFACELYAPSLPDIERYIGQRIPVQPIDPALLVPVPRPPRAPVEGQESIAQVFAEARAHAPPGKDRRERSGRGPARDERGARAGAERGRRGERGARPQRAAAVRPAHELKAAPADAPARAARDAAIAAAPGAPAGANERRRRRRRRRGRGRGGEAAASEVAGASAAAAARDGAPPPESHGGGHERPRLLTRIRQGFSRFVNRLRGGPRR